MAAFKQRVAQYFQVAGISMTNRSEQGPVGDYMDVTHITYHLGRNGRR